MTIIRPESTRTAHALVSRVVEPGEEILWTGRPHLPTLTGEAERIRVGRSPVASIAATLVLMAAGVVGFLLWQGMDPAAVGDRILSWLQGGAWVVVLLTLGLVGAATGLRRMGFDDAGAFIRWAQRQTYAITDRRLLILDGERIAHAFAPAQLGAIRLRDRAEGYGDVEFKELPQRTNRGPGDYRNLKRDRRRIAFKALPDAHAVRARIEDWRRDHLQRTERSAAAFLDARTGRGSARAAGAGAERLVRNDAYGLQIRLPADWTVKVRRRRKPYGMFALELERWSAPEERDDWNVLRVDGPYHSAVELHLDAVPRLVKTYEESLRSSLPRMLGGELVDSEPQVRWGRFTGYSITRRFVGAGSDAGQKQPVLMRERTLHDGSMQLVSAMTWPEGSAPLRAVTAEISDGITVPPLPPDRKVRMPSRGCAPLVLGGVRVLVGLLVLGLGLFAGYDQSRRAFEYRAAQTELRGLAANGIPVLPADRLTTAHDGELAFLHGTLIPPTLRDPLTGYAIRGWRLERSVQLRQWQEIREREGRASGDSTVRVRYEEVWSDRLIDSDDFQQPLFGEEHHVNPKEKPLPDEIFIGDQMRIGAWALSPYYGSDIDERQRAPGASSSDVSLKDGWTADEGFLYHKDQPNLRIRYEAHPVQAGQYGVLGVPQDGVLSLDGPMAELPLIGRGVTDAESLVASVQGRERGVNPVWMAYTFVGLMLLIRPLARLAPGLRAFVRASFGRRLAITAATAAALTGVAALLMP